MVCGRIRVRLPGGVRCAFVRGRMDQRVARGRIARRAALPPHEGLCGEDESQTRENDLMELGSVIFM